MNAPVERPSPNHNARPAGAVISAVVVHDTASKTAEEALSWFAKPASKVSAHFVIDLDGTVYQCVPEDRRAWHAGTSTLHGASEVNDFSVGIEVVDASEIVGNKIEFALPGVSRPDAKFHTQ